MLGVTRVPLPLPLPLHPAPCGPEALLANEKYMAQQKVTNLGNHVFQYWSFIEPLTLFHGANPFQGRRQKGALIVLIKRGALGNVTKTMGVLIF